MLINALRTGSKVIKNMKEIIYTIPILMSLVSASFADIDRAKQAFDEGDYNYAYDEYLMDAENGHPEAQFYMGVLYFNGVGTKKDLTEALRWYKLSARKGFPIAQHSIANMYEIGVGVEQNYQEAFNWYKKAAVQGLRSAQYSLGEMFRNGTGVDKDEIEAAKWTIKAAESDHALAQYNLSILYDLGIGVAVDKAKSREWTERAAMLGVANAQYNLAAFYINGQVSVGNLISAHQWFTISQRSGHKQAAEGKATLEEYMPAEDIAEAIKRADIWFAERRK
ncbi:MAG: sel1 repeat family protein [Kordiimonadaceae bacterium]|jgi:uncharacterized protein|nr:sel1 repeat family protein [Kordiimonadaceae bacterium]MBT6030960.1 sel1 repeat family protein [Kordiimonadaceae bacterium]